MSATVTTATERPGQGPDEVIRRTVLVADDEGRMRRLLAAALQDADVELLEARDGRHALEAARRERPLLVLLDTTMPVLDAIEVCRAIRTDPDLAATVVVMLTAQGQRDARARALAAGADGYLTKPFLLGDLLRVVDRWTGGPSTRGHA